MKNSNIFQYAFFGLFIFFIIVGTILFATYRSNNDSEISIPITIWGSLPASSFNTFTSDFFQANNLKYQVSYVEKEPANFDRDLIEALASGSGPDAIILPMDLIVRFESKIYPIPYASLPILNFKDTFIEEGELYLTSRGTIALPFAVDPLVMYWNRDIFNNAGITKPPAIWPEILSLVPLMTKKDAAANITNSTVALGEFRNVVNAKEILSALLIQAGSQIVLRNTDDSLDNDLNQDSAVRAMQFFTNFSNPSKRDYSWNRALPNSLEVFANGDLAMYFGFASEYSSIKDKNPNLNFAVATLPQVDGAEVKSAYGNMLGLAIMKRSANPALAYSVISSLTSASAYEHWRDIFNMSSTRRDILSQAEANPVKAIFNKSAIISKGWLDPNKVETSEIFQEMVESYTTGRNDLSSAVSQASARLGSLLK